MAGNLSALLVTALLCLSAAAMAHENPSNHDDAIGDFKLPIFARLHVLWETLNCFVPQARPARSEPLVVNVDVIMFCGEDRIAAAQTLTDLSRPFDFVMDIKNDAVSEPLRVVQECLVVVTFPGGACVARPRFIGSLADHLVGDMLGHGHNYYDRNARLYQAKDFHPYNY